MSDEKPRAYHLWMRPQEQEMINKLKGITGQNPTEMFRALLREAYFKQFPPYVKKNIAEIKEKFDPEQECLRQGGEVIDKNGVPTCRVMYGKSCIDTPLSVLKP